MLPLFLALCVAAADAPRDEGPAAAPAPPVPDLLQPEPSEALRPAPAHKDQPFGLGARVGLSLGAGVVGAAAALGITLLLVSGNANLDSRFATAALGAILTSGGAFAVHQVLGGKGEVVLAFLAGCLGFAAAALAALAIDPAGSVPLGPLLIAGIGAAPAAGLAVLTLELTAGSPLHSSVTVSPTGLLVRF